MDESDGALYKCLLVELQGRACPARTLKILNFSRAL